MISMYVEHLILGGFSREEVLELKTVATHIFQALRFKCTNTTPTVN